MEYLTTQIKDKAKELRKDYPTLSVYESLNLAAKIQKNELYAKANYFEEINDNIEAIADKLPG